MSLAGCRRPWHGGSPPEVTGTIGNFLSIAKSGGDSRTEASYWESDVEQEPSKQRRPLCHHQDLGQKAIATPPNFLASELRVGKPVECELWRGRLKVFSNTHS